MRITVEIGNVEQKEHIRQELEIFVKVSKSFDSLHNVSEVIVPSDFEAKVNELLGISTYKASRGLASETIDVLAKVIELGNGISIVLSPNLFFSGKYNAHTRCLTYVHELSHIINRQKFPQYQVESFLEKTYFGNIYHMFDEYAADRLAYKVIDQVFQTQDANWQAYLQDELSSFTSLVTDKGYYEAIRAKSKTLLDDHNKDASSISQFLNDISQIADEVAISTVHLYAIVHQYPTLAISIDLSTSKFIDERTIQLLNFFKNRFEQNNYDLKDGISLMAEYLTIFGVSFRETSKGAEFQILEI